MLRDIRQAIRGLRQTPLFTLAVTVALGLGLGANATIFGLIDGLWLRPPGITHPGTLRRVFATTTANTRSTWSFPEYLDIRDRTRTLTDVVALGRRGSVITKEDGSSELVLANVTSLNFFTAMGISAAHGRLFAPDDERALEAEPGVVLGHAYWQRAFGGDPSIVGRMVNVDRGDSAVALRVLGVVSPGFRDLDAAGDRDLWMPVATWARLNGRSEFETRDNRWFEVFARQTGDVASASEEIKALAAGFARDYPSTNADRSGRVQTDRAHRFERAGPMATIVLVLVLIVVVITSLNVTQLLMARALARRRELAVRVALGAARARLLRELLVEAAALGLLGAAAGLGLAAWLIRLLPNVIVTPPGFSAFAVFTLDARVFVFTLAIALLSMLIFGLPPAWRASRADVVTLIKADAGSSGAGRRFGATSRSALLVGQIAVSLVLVYAAAMLVRSFEATRRADLGFARSPILTAWVPFGAAPRELVAEAQHRLAALPGVSSVAVAIRAPLSLSGGGLSQPVIIPSAGPPPVAPPSVRYNAVSSSYFDTMGSRVLQGRGFTAAEEQPGEPVIVVNEQFARTFFQGDAVGQLVRLGGASGVDHRVVGVIANSLVIRIGERPAPYFFLPFARVRNGEATLLVATQHDATSLAVPIRDTLTAIDRRLTPRRLTLLSELIDYSSGEYRATAALSSLLAMLGLVLTAIGVYGVLASRTTRRTREIGVRIALGATRGQVLRLIYRDGASVAIAGILLGTPLALVTARSMGSMLFGLAPDDWLTLAFTGAVLMAAVSAATLIPAWRATRVQPSTALRDS